MKSKFAFSTDTKAYYEFGNGHDTTSTTDGNATTTATFFNVLAWLLAFSVAMLSHAIITHINNK